MAAGGNGTATVIRETTEDQTGAAAAWVAMFAEGWANPVDTDTFCDHFDPWFDPEVRMIQPSVRPTVGRKGFREAFARPLFTLVPNLRGSVENWSATGDVVYIGRQAALHAPYVRPDQASQREGGRAGRLPRPGAPTQGSRRQPTGLAAFHPRPTA